ncbi:MAG: putative immunity protein [Bacillota bacterium]
MPKPRKTLGDWKEPYLQSLMRLIETQSKATIVSWCLACAEARFLPIYQKSFPDDARPMAALNAAREWMDGKIKLPEARKRILDAHAAAREAEDIPAAQAAARAIGQAASTIHAPAHSLGIAFYGAAAAAYDRVGINEKPEVYERIAAGECAKLEEALRAVAVENEPNPAKIGWRC